MHIGLVTPAAPRSRAGNRATATRWAALLRRLGHRVSVRERWRAGDAGFDLLLALHAWRSAESIEAFAQHYPDRALVLALTGTDIYRFQHTHPEVTAASIERADALIGLHDQVSQAIPERFHSILHTVHQSALPLPPSYRGPPKRRFNVCVVGHLRAEKDSLLSARAARQLPATSRIVVTQAGKAHDADWAESARGEAVTNRRYQWLGEVSQAATRALYARSHIMVISSVMEGGANVVSEACVAHLPVLASDIPGNTGLLGLDYPGLFPVGDAKALAQLMTRAETDGNFYQRLHNHCRALAPRFTPAQEQAALQRVIHAVSA